MRRWAGPSDRCPARRILHTAAEPPGMRAKLDTDTLLAIVLVLVAVWLVLAIISQVVSLLSSLLPFTNLIGLVIIVLILLWWFDYL